MHVHYALVGFACCFLKGRLIHEHCSSFILPSSSLWNKSILSVPSSTFCLAWSSSYSAFWPTILTCRFWQILPSSSFPGASIPPSFLFPWGFHFSLLPLFLGGSSPPLSPFPGGGGGGGVSIPPPSSSQCVLFLTSFIFPWEFQSSSFPFPWRFHPPLPLSLGITVKCCHYHAFSEGVAFPLLSLDKHTVGFIRLFILMQSLYHKMLVFETLCSMPRRGY